MSVIQATLSCSVGPEFISNILCKNYISLCCIIPYAANFLPSVLKIVVLPDDGQVGLKVGKYTKSLKNKQFCCH